MFEGRTTVLHRRLESGLKQVLIIFLQLFLFSADIYLDSSFKSHLISRCQDRVNQLTFPECQIIQTKLALIKLLRAQPQNQIVKTSTNYLIENKSVVGHQYVRNLAEILDRNLLVENQDFLKHFICFSMGSWSVCVNQHVYSSAFPSQTCALCDNVIL